MGQLSNKSQSARPRLSHKVFLHSLNGLKVVLQQSGPNTHRERYTEILVSIILDRLVSL